MKDDFKKKLDAYEKGELSEAEKEKVEQELEKLEKYYEFIDEKEDKDRKVNPMNDEKQIKILRRSKWKARFQTAIMVISILFFVTILSTILTAVYYSWGKPDRVDTFRNIIDYTLTVTNPYGYYGGTSTNTKPFFSMEASRELNKRVGDETLVVGEMKVNFLFSMMGFPMEDYYGRMKKEQPGFILPGFESEMADWNQLEQLPEGTVVSAYVSFSELLTTNDVFQLFNGRNLDIIWFAVYTGQEGESRYAGNIFEPIGFPDFPIWHDNDMILDSREEEKGLFGSKVISESYYSPEYESGDYEQLHTQFMKTLAFLSKYESKANKLTFEPLNLDDRIQYLKEHGIEHYGAVITGPTKEILKLQEEPMISDLAVDEVSFWNWEWDRSEEE
ncbi:anti-sigma factor [Ornithinibacillus sp. FSL M8-0202]|uniref:anti-sigma factor n=1 Tax=Ornithinibacillus sp. FSL M8-0202 TaxID=2921616 RepID=UPI0030CDB637